MKQITITEDLYNKIKTSTLKDDEHELMIRLRVEISLYNK